MLSAERLSASPTASIASPRTAPSHAFIPVRGSVALEEEVVLVLEDAVVELEDCAVVAGAELDAAEELDDGVEEPPLEAGVEEGVLVVPPSGSTYWLSPAEEPSAWAGPRRTKPQSTVRKMTL